VARRFLLDENVDPAVGASLTEAGHDVVHVQNVDVLGKRSSDHEIAAHAKRSARCIMTSDDDFYREIDEEVPTLFFVPEQRLDAHRIASIVGAIEEQFPDDELDDQRAIAVVEGWL
jgi:peptide subunit release factor 1 (eRF1)